MALLHRNGILHPDVPELIQTGRFPELFHNAIDYLPFYRKGKHENLWKLAIDTLKKWIFSAEIVAANTENLGGRTELILQDAYGTKCCVQCSGSVEYKLGNVFCMGNVFYLRLQGRADGVQYFLTPAVVIPAGSKTSAVVDIAYNQLFDLQHLIASTSKYVCWNCKVPEIAKSHCTKCGLALYCSRDCQVADWPNHKKWCKGKKTVICCVLFC